MATKDYLQVHFRECEYTLRDSLSHKHHCSLINGPDSAKHSADYGVNRRSLLEDLPYFSVVKAMPHDIMHNIFEGVVPYEMKLLIDFCSNTQSYFSLATLNHRIVSFDYGYSEMGDKPAIIHESKLRQTASQMWLLARMFPLLVGDLVPQDCQNWLCFLKPLKICEICTSTQLTPDYAAYLEVLIEEHHTEFVKLYPSKLIIPKMHFMVHFPQQILDYGPLINTWTMRHEAKLRIIKRAARVSNYKNVCKTVALHHQHLLCLYINTNYVIGSVIKYGPSKAFSVSSQPEALQLLLRDEVTDCSLPLLPVMVSLTSQMLFFYLNLMMCHLFFVKYSSYFMSLEDLFWL